VIVAGRQERPLAAICAANPGIRPPNVTMPAHRGCRPATHHHSLHLIGAQRVAPSATPREGAVMTTADEPMAQPGDQTELPARGLSIAEAARRSGVTVYTLRYYERVGMMPKPPARTGGGSRRYHAAELEWIDVCTKLRAIGMSTQLIRQYVDLVRAGPGNEHRRLELLESHRADVLERMAKMAESLELIEHKIAAYRGRLADGDADRLWSTPR
jgi:DNA-binding transcriptional MerR regulator